MTEDEIQAAFMAREQRAYEERVRDYLAAFTEEERTATEKAIEVAFVRAFYHAEKSFVATFDDQLRAMRSSLAMEALRAVQEERRIYKKEWDVYEKSRLSLEEQDRVFVEERKKEFGWGHPSMPGKPASYYRQRKELRDRHWILVNKGLPISSRRHTLVKKQLAFAARMRDFRAWALERCASDMKDEAKAAYEAYVEIREQEAEEDEYERVAEEEARDREEARWGEMTAEERELARGSWWPGAPDDDVHDMGIDGSGLWLDQDGNAIDEEGEPYDGP